MTFKDLMEACYEAPYIIRVSNGQIEGIITQIKFTGIYKGCAVTFDNGPGYDIWFYSEDGHDQRKHYMKQLILI